MMHAYARWICKPRVAWAIVVAVCVLAAVSWPLSRRVGRDDDMLAFLPKGNPEVATFRAINERFGGLDIAIVGLEVRDPFDAEFLTDLRTLTRDLSGSEHVQYALSLTNVEDFTLDPAKGGVRTEYLVAEIPATPEAKSALRAKVMSREHVVSNLVSADEKAVIIYCFLRNGANPRAAADHVQEATEAAFPTLTKHWGGAPFASTYIYNVTDQDLGRLMPWAVAVILIITVLSFRDLVGTILMLLSTGIAILAARGLMGLFGVHENIVLGSLPIILFALGSAYGIQVLCRYYALVAVVRDTESALATTVVEVGPPVIAAGLTTVVGQWSYLVMDIKPLRIFGLYSGFGILVGVVLALTFIPAVIRLARPRARYIEGEDPAGKLIGRLMAHVARRRWAWGLGCGALALLGGVFVSRVDARMESASFFAEGSPPAEAERFLSSHFGGSQFLQVELSGDMTDPDVLRELTRVADEIALMPHVSSVAHIGQVLSLANEVMVGERRVPLSDAQVKLLYRLLAGRDTVRIFVTDDRQKALVQVKIDSDRADDMEPLIAAVESYVADRALKGYTVERRDAARSSEVKARLEELVALRIAAVAKTFGSTIDAAGRQRIEAAVREPAGAADVDRVKERIGQFLRSDESILEGEKEAPSLAVAEALAALGPDPSEPALVGAIAHGLERPREDELVEDLALSLATPLGEIWRQEKALAGARRIVASADLTVPEGDAGARLSARVADAVLDLDRATALLPATGGAQGELSMVVSGTPVLYRGLSRSVTANQLLSLGSSLLLVLVIMCVLFRSITSGLLSTAPLFVALLLVYGAMGAMGIHLDIGTSMLASLVIGEAVDYAMHLMAEWRSAPAAPVAEAASRAGRLAGTAILTSAVTVAAGFYVLTLGQSVPLRNVGGLTAVALLVSAAAAILVLPVLARKRSYIKSAKPVVTDHDPADIGEAEVALASQPGTPSEP
jgi:predicted RND superfamily exporter protein